MLKKDIIRIILYGVGLTSVAALVYMAGPLVVIGDYRPLESYVVREILILLLLAAAASIGSFYYYKRKKNSDQIAEGLAQDQKADNDSLVLKERMKDALTTLKKSAGGRRNYLYDLPWYILIGPPGAGKTTALVHSGLKFPLAAGATPAAVAGVGGTRYCDWWFTEQAVLVDTAGRYTTQDSDAKADKQSWLSFLDLLKKKRPRQPINGVMIAISLEDILTLDSGQLTAHATAIRARLLELHDRLKVDFPVYALFTKADLVAGFSEFFADLNERGRQQVWGATFQTADKTRNMVGEMPGEFDALVERLNNELTDRLQEEPSPGARVSLFGFPAQMAALKRPCFDFLNQIFEPTRYHANATMRGFYFTSGTQLGTPIDQLIGTLTKTFGAQEIAGTAYSGRGKSYFLTDLISKVIIGEAAWVSTNRGAVTRARIVKAVAYSFIALVAIALTSGWWTSFLYNRDLIAQTDKAIADYRANIGPLGQETTIGDRDFAKILAPLHRLQNLPAGFANRNVQAPVLAGLGLSQRGRLQSSSVNAYHVGLERMFRSRLIYRMEEMLEANRDNASFVYEALKVYMMLGGLQAADRELILSWWRRDWADNLYPGSANEEGRKSLEEHLTAMLELEGGQEPLITLNGPLVEESQKTLARLSVSQRAYELLKSQARTSSSLDWIAARHAGPDFALVFETTNGESIDSVRVPAFFTYSGFRQLFIARLGDIAERMKRDRWVLGPAGDQSAVAVQYDRLGPDLLELYSKDFIAAWQSALGKLRIRRLTADKPKYVALAAASSSTSPIKQLLESVRDETALTRERRPDTKNAAEPKPDRTAAETTPTLLKQQDQAPGANIEATFKGFHVLVEGEATRRPIDAIVANLAEINQSLTLLATSPQLAPQATTALQTQLASLRANAARMPQPFQDMLVKAAGFFESDLTNSSHTELQRRLGDQVTGTCQQIVGTRYPFAKGSDRDVPLADFGRLFAPNGIIDKFFAQHLAAMADTSKQAWSWRQDNPLARSLSPGSLREFQRAAQIRDAFFATGGIMPSVNFNVTPPALNDANTTVKLDVNGATVESKAGSTSPVAIQWPGGGGNRATVSVTTNYFGQASGAPSVLERTGPWALFRLIDASSPVQRGDRVIASFIVGGRELQYQIAAGSVHNPLTLAALREFRCPSGL